jgi:hypothetical protein
LKNSRRFATGSTRFAGSAIVPHLTVMWNATAPL